ncbi:carboxymuconolactone decarboxylase family protein [Actinokineospora sp. HUAS TT18]|uniref:carboxymuconolactone decarboxylase family protein n=1 Tax=Actinokineospora sp. HUAS TT18 TaxID=3447451 RepID=UPI003F528600
MRIYLDKQSPSVYKALTALSAELKARAADAGVPRTTLELVNIRVSQLNHCVFCLDLHSRLALEAGETPQRLALLPAWRETTLYTAKERAALALAEAVTEVQGDHISDEDYAAARAELNDDELSLIVWAAITINTFNRVSILSGHPIQRRG